MKTLTLKQIQGGSKPAVYQQKYDTRTLVYDGVEIFVVAEILAEFAPIDGIHKTWTLCHLPLPDLPKEGWRYLEQEDEIVYV